ncbi:MAG: nuclear transport factor 2 family protein [Opitutus sp.]
MKAFSLRLVPALLGLMLFPIARAAESAAVAAVRNADQARLAAMMAGDGAALGRLMSDALIFVHSDGRTESKADYVRNMMAGDTEYADAVVTDVRAVEPGPGVVILIGAQQMRKRLGSTWSNISLRYMAVWREEGGAWRMFAWQSMRPAGNSVVPAAR